MIQLSRELKTGIVVIVVTALFIWGFNFLKGHNLFEGPANSYYTTYENVQGLNTASAVTINGFEVGKVVDISFNPNAGKRGQLIVEFTLEKDFQFSKKSIAKVYSASLMGGKSLAILPSYEGEIAKPGDYLKGEIESDMFSSFGEKLNPLQAKLENVIVSADSLLVHLNEVLDVKTIRSIKNSLTSFEKTMKSVESTSRNADSIVKENRNSIRASLKNTEKITQNFSKLSDTLSKAKIGQMLAKLDKTIANIQTLTANINQGKGTVGKLMTDEALYRNLEKSTKELEELLQDMKLNPKRYVHFSVFGKKGKEYVKPEAK